MPGGGAHLNPLIDYPIRAAKLIWETVGPGLPYFATSFLSVLIGALPFIVVAVLASAFLEVFVSRETLARWIPRNPVLGVFLAPLAGFLIPMCECGIVPVARRLIIKGAPLPVALAFMLANPILNPLVILSTRLAFPNQPLMVWWRIGLGYGVAVLTALVVAFFARQPATAYLLDAPAAPGPHAHHHHAHAETSLAARLRHFLEHAGEEFFSVGRYFIIGAFLAAIAQAFIGRSLLEAIGRGPALSVAAMMGFAFLLSICSEADAFVAATFASTFTFGALLAFLVFGPMTDVKNTMMMLSVFRRRFVVGLNVTLVVLNFAAGYALNRYF